MANHTTETLVGAAVLAVAVGFLGYASKFTDFASGGSDYALSASFRSIEGVSVGTDVRMVGVKVGTVSDIKLDTELFRATTVLSMRNGVPVPNDSTAVIASEGLLGGNFVEILPGASFDNYQPGDEILDTQGSVSLMNLLLKFVSGSGDSGSTN